MSAFKKFKDEIGFCHVADLTELEENGFNLNIPRYVDTSEPEEPVNISKTIEKINEIKNDITSIKENVDTDLENLGFEKLS